MGPVEHFFGGAYRGRRVLVTGNSGFKGAHLAWILRMLGAEVAGYSISIPTEPALFPLLPSPPTVWGDILDTEKLDGTVAGFAPEIIFHLAAQPLVRRSYREPRETFMVNVQGTVNVLDAARRVPSVRAVVAATSDKCYENGEVARGYVETDPMGGHDPYSASKGCAELAIASYRRAFGDAGKLLASVRAGNVVGGGDWAEDRLVPDLARAAAAGAELEIRSPGAVRPWQHVFEPLTGYLALGARLLAGEEYFASAWNFGPEEGDARSVGDVAVLFAAAWPRARFRFNPPPDAPHEAGLLMLNCAKAKRELGWHGVWTPEECFAFTARSYRDYYEKKQINTAEDFAAYCRDAHAKGLPWTN